MKFRLRNIIVVLLTTGTCAVTPLRAQFVHFSMRVEPELSAGVIQRLDFGTVVVNSGINTVEPGNPRMGVFEIRSLNNRELLVTLHAPEYLVHTDRDMEDRIPIHLQASYTNNGIRDFRQSRAFPGNTAWLQVGNSRSRAGDNSWETAYIYVYGSIEVGQVANGDYSGVLVLNVEYY